MRLPTITFPYAVDTLGKKLALGAGMSVHCNTYLCLHWADINLVALARRIGMDHSSMADDLRPHFYCSKCRAAGRPDRNIGFIGHVLTLPHSKLPEDHPALRLPAD